MSIGVTYIATGRRFIDEACVSAASLKLRMPQIPITIFADGELESAHFENVVYIRSARYGPVDKILHIGSSPYEQTVFLDTDTYVCDDISELFTLLDRFDIAVAHAPYRAAYRIDGVPDSFPEFNTGVVVFKASPKIARFFSQWRALYERDLKRSIRWLHPLEDTLFNGSLPNQATFREALYHSDLRVATLTPEYNCRFIFPGFAHNPVKILHGRHGRLSKVAEDLNADTAPRVYVNVRGSLRVIARPQPSKYEFRDLRRQVRWSIHQRGFWGTVAAVMRRVARG